MCTQKCWGGGVVLKSFTIKVSKQGSRCTSGACVPVQWRIQGQEFWEEKVVEGELTKRGLGAKPLVGYRGNNRNPYNNLSFAVFFRLLFHAAEIQLVDICIGGLVEPAVGHCLNLTLPMKLDKQGIRCTSGACLPAHKCQQRRADIVIWFWPGYDLYAFFILLTILHSVLEKAWTQLRF